MPPRGIPQKSKSLEVPISRDSSSSGDSSSSRSITPDNKNSRDLYFPTYDRNRRATITGLTNEIRDLFTQDVLPDTTDRPGPITDHPGPITDNPGPITDHPGSTTDNSSSITDNSSLTTKYKKRFSDVFNELPNKEAPWHTAYKELLAKHSERRQELQQQVDVEKGKLPANQQILDNAQKTFDKSTGEVARLSQWTIEPDVQKQLNAWKETHSDAPEPKAETIHEFINAAQATIKSYEHHLDESYKLKDQISAEFNELSYHIFQKLEDYNELKSNIEKIGGKDKARNPLLQEITDLETEVTQLEQGKTNLLTQIELQQIGKINTSIDEKEGLKQQVVGDLENAEKLLAERREGLQQQVAAEKEKHSANQQILDNAKETFNESVLPEVVELKKWTKEAHAQKRLNELKKAHPDTLAPQSGTLYNFINIGHMTVLDHDYILSESSELKNQISDELSELSSYTFPKAGDYKALKSNIEKTFDNGDLKNTLLQELTGLETQTLQYEQTIKQANSYIEKINEVIKNKKEKQELAMEEQEKAEMLIPEEYPFFKENDMRDVTATITLVDKGELVGSNTVDMLRTLLQHQPTVDVTDEDTFAKAVGLHPAGESIDFKWLKTNLEALGDKEGHQHQTISDKYLETALRGGKPIIAILDNKQSLVPQPKPALAERDGKWETLNYNLKRAVILARFVREPGSGERKVVVIDRLRKGGTPFEINFKKFTKEAWTTREVILSQAAFEAVEQERGAN